MLRGEPAKPNTADPSASASNDPSRSVGEGYGESRSPAMVSALNAPDARCPAKLQGSPPVGDKGAVPPSASKDDIRPPKGKGELLPLPRGGR